jgi:hypothetical protein
LAGLSKEQSVPQIKPGLIWNCNKGLFRKPPFTQKGEYDMIKRLADWLEKL